MTDTRHVLEGTWEEIAQHAGDLAGKRLRVTVLEEAGLSSPQGEPFYKTATPEERAQAFLEWGNSHAPRNATALSDEAISRESIYFGEGD